MSLRYPFAIVKPGFNALAAQTTTTYYDLFMWGNNEKGQLGGNNTILRSSPVQVGSVTISTSWSSLARGSEHTIGIKNDGTSDEHEKIAKYMKSIGQ